VRRESLERAGRSAADGALDVVGALLRLVPARAPAGETARDLDRTLHNLRRQLDGGDETDVSAAGMSLPEKVAYQLGGVKVLIDAGVVRPVRPDRLVHMVRAIARFGRSPAAGSASLAARYPDEPMIVDELGTLTYREVHERTNALAHAFAAAGIAAGDGVGIMCRNHRGFIEATFAVSKLGANALYLNTAFAGPQLTEVVKREQPKAIVYDEEFSGLLAEAGEDRLRFVAWHDADGCDDPTLDELIASGDRADVTPPGSEGRSTILTSGTTGTPKGAARANPQSLDPAISLLERIPLKSRQVSQIAAPMFHSWGFAHLSIGLIIGSTFVLRRRFDPEECLAEIARHRCDSLVVVPVMMQRILELPEDVRRRYDASSLSAVAASGSALPGDLATDWMDAFGDSLYNLYGSTEVAWATIATPEDMRAAPGTAGRPARGVVVRLYDADEREVSRGQTGRIFVGNEMLFEGYTGGGTKDVIDGLMATGDVGRFDEAGRLFVEGRDDEMIVSGGENVFPKEIEDLLCRHEAVVEAAAVGVEDRDFGQRLRAFVVLEKGVKTSEADLKSYVKSNLARYKVPREVVFLDELPRNATGKILKRELRQLEPEGEAAAS
jgi:acyl-CoA synthetase (AMP-forming)/AMP-acid ligase II